MQTSDTDTGPQRNARALSAHFTLRLPRQMVERLDEVAANRLDAPDRAQVIRELLAKQLALA